MAKEINEFEDEEILAWLIIEGSRGKWEKKKESKKMKNGCTNGLMEEELRPFTWGLKRNFLSLRGKK